jgi:hypothetical protein
MPPGYLQRFGEDFCGLLRRRLGGKCAEPPAVCQAGRGGCCRGGPGQSRAASYNTGSVIDDHESARFPAFPF